MTLNLLIFILYFHFDSLPQDTSLRVSQSLKFANQSTVGNCAETLRSGRVGGVALHHRRASYVAVSMSDDPKKALTAEALRDGLEALSRLGYSRLVQSRTLRDDFRRQIGIDLDLIKGVAAMLPRKSAGPILKEEQFLEAVRRLVGVVRMSTIVATELEPKLLSDLVALDDMLAMADRDFRLPVARTDRWRIPEGPL
jgi:hypothetical protein